MLLETIRCEEGLPLHLSYHQNRLETSLQSLGIDKVYDLKALITPPPNGIFRCRFLYDANHYFIEFIPYTPKKIISLKLIDADEIEYSLKYAERKNLDFLYNHRAESDDVLIVKNGFLTDTTIANIALLIAGKWITPEAPLLMGTTRARMLDEGVIIPAPLRVDDIAKATKIALMNAMIDFLEVENGIMT